MCADFLNNLRLFSPQTHPQLKISTLRIPSGRKSEVYACSGEIALPHPFQGFLVRKGPIFHLYLRVLEICRSHIVVGSHFFCKRYAFPLFETLNSILLVFQRLSTEIHQSSCSKKSFKWKINLCDGLINLLFQRSWASFLTQTVVMFNHLTAHH